MASFKIDIHKFAQGEKIATKNKTGAMVTNISDISKQFIADTQKLSSNDTVVDIGCCYGITTLTVLEQSSCKVIGIDLSAEHLEVLAKSVDPKDAGRLVTIEGKFPQVLQLADASIAAVHASHLLQFLSGEEIEQGIIKCYRALQPGGKVYFSTTSIYLPWTQAFLPEYERRVAEGQKWPGEIHNFTDYAPEAAKNFVTDFFHVLTKDRLTSILEKHGFSIETSFYYDVNNPSDQAEDKKEMLAVIAVKL
ncbi:MAG: hypothetical protein K0Q57_1121 [Gammaproteobacteria bacterium]|jgi:ubiquinone/menaquinone biosynthesis C-methylase UbiE|nr:hypothetical protein [Gammaproteobacteria bacterium]